MWNQCGFLSAGDAAEEGGSLRERGIGWTPSCSTRRWSHGRCVNARTRRKGGLPRRWGLTMSPHISHEVAPPCLGGRGGVGGGGSGGVGGGRGGVAGGVGGVGGVGGG